VLTSLSAGDVLVMRTAFRPAATTRRNDRSQDDGHDAAGRPEAAPIAQHTWGTKAEKSGFFNLPDSENLSAVLFTNAGTLNKFNRMGVGAGFGSERITLIRRGTAWDPDPNASKPVPFEHVVVDGSSETWVEGMDVFHNPTRSTHWIRTCFPARPTCRTTR
jgi:hypothetical protein